MENSNWSRVEGMIIARRLDPQKMTDYLAERGVLAQLDWFKDTPQMMGIRIGLDGDRVASLPSAGQDLVPGPTLIDLIEDMAGTFAAEVMIGDMGIDRLADAEEGSEDVPVPDEDDEAVASSDEAEGLRIVEIGATPASAVPLMAAFEGVDIASLDLPGGKRALLAVLPRGKEGWSFGDVPLVTLTASGDEFQAFLIEDDDPENITTYNWGMEERIVAGGAGDDPEAIKIAQALVGSRQDIEAIHNAVPGIDPELAFGSTQLRGVLAVNSFVASLGLPSSVAEFLRGRRDPGDVEGATLHQARGVSNAIGRSVDIMLGERRTEGASLWDTYTKLVTSKPWLVPVASVSEAAVGVLILSASRGRGEPRSAGKKFGTFVGIALLVDSLAELSLAKYVNLREQRRAEQAEG